MSKKQQNNNSTPIEVSIDEFDGIDEAMDTAITEADREKNDRIKAVANKASKKRKEVTEVKRSLGIKAPSKISQFPTRSHAFLSEKTSDRAVHFILNQSETEIYKDGVDIAPRILMGIPAYGKSCKKNAFEHLINAQEKLRDARGEDPSKAPKWIIISNDSSLIADRNLINRLEELKEGTGVAGAFGYNQIRASGRWYTTEPLDETRGQYIQASSDNLNWSHITGGRFNESTKWRTLIIHGPFIAVRGDLFMNIDFKYMFDHSELGYYHYMADISLECEKRGLKVAQVKTIAIQYDKIEDHISKRELQVDQSCFTSKWQDFLPKKI